VAQELFDARACEETGRGQQSTGPPCLSEGRARLIE